MTVLLYSRPDCPLCDEARESMKAAGAEFEEIDVSGDLALEAEYGLYVPVVELDGRVVFHAGMDAAELPALI